MRSLRGSLSHGLNLHPQIEFLLAVEGKSTPASLLACSPTRDQALVHVCPPLVLSLKDASVLLMCLNELLRQRGDCKKADRE